MCVHTQFLERSLSTGEEIGLLILPKHKEHELLKEDTLKNIKKKFLSSLTKAEKNQIHRVNSGSDNI